MAFFARNNKCFWLDLEALAAYLMIFVFLSFFQYIIIPRTITYFAHPYSSWERGSNENQNRMIRRFIPKGTPISSVSQKEVNRIEKWMNNYPRKKLGYKSARDVSATHMQNISNLEFSLESFAL